MMSGRCLKLQSSIISEYRRPPQYISKKKSAKSLNIALSLCLGRPGLPHAWDGWIRGHNANPSVAIRPPQETAVGGGAHCKCHDSREGEMLESRDGPLPHKAHSTQVVARVPVEERGGRRSEEEKGEGNIARRLQERRNAVMTKHHRTSAQSVILSWEVDRILGEGHQKQGHNFKFVCTNQG